MELVAKWRKQAKELRVEAEITSFQAGEGMIVEAGSLDDCADELERAMGESEEQ
jgi:hypothetical protein